MATNRCLTSLFMRVAHHLRQRWCYCHAIAHAYAAGRRGCRQVAGWNTYGGQARHSAPRLPPASCTEPCWGGRAVRLQGAFAAPLSCTDTALAIFLAWRAGLCALSLLDVSGWRQTLHIADVWDSTRHACAWNTPLASPATQLGARRPAFSAAYLLLPFFAAPHSRLIFMCEHRAARGAQRPHRGALVCA